MIPSRRLLSSWSTICRKALNDNVDSLRRQERAFAQRAEYEYAATSKGKNRPYPWGTDEATCEKAVMYGNNGYRCGSGGTMPVCSKPSGNTEQGASIEDSRGGE